ncbi:two-component system, NtrC family, C4-dicarboxylate transport sensor histidine kinase DctB [Collimonas sp. OK242]|jgi:two-component system C4-dicarboxylate transport sensor histidine kinase DctB|uniref:sensor histidine kinase n=1 Tax=Collimonas sp. OK242 TaxID=1798195 RepID=UPI00089D43AC|nr:ATP-binding protein [Collimonas sp. OK242]SDX20951.1 two-component system, NtrC family, C4-dicarboxylate transport sensor histidine kinase DctB [Collimonas sp. OK242]
MTAKKPLLWTVLAIASVIAVVLSTYVLASRKAGSDIGAASERQLQIIALDLESVLQKFETLPFALGFQSDVLQALAQPDDQRNIQHLNQTLQLIQRQSEAVAIYVLDRKGLTLASSNWDTPTSFVGRDFGFRPYFRDAIKGNAGRFYGIGNATNVPGYFIAQPIYASAAGNGANGANAALGVMVVKIDLTEFEHTWRSSEEPITLVDSSGVVFLSNRPAWKYHSLYPLNGAIQQDLAGTHQYADQAITPVASLPKPQRAEFGQHVTRGIGRLGWQLMLFPSQARIARIAMLWTLAAVLLLAIAGISLWALYQRRRRLEERLVSAECLDRTIAQRTQELRVANQTLEAKYAKLKETEHLLRSTQNKLIQAGKLAMLGQMAAGIAHELNQPLAAIRAFADNAMTFLTRGQADKATENLSHISNASARMGKIVGQLNGFSRKSHEAVAVIDLPKSIEAAALLLNNEFQTHGATLQIDIRHPAQVVGDSVRTEQVLINLLRNALDAVDNAEQKTVSLLLECEAGEAVVRIRDCGPGIPAQVALHLFEPFFTTKPSGKGLGLGLAISSSIVQAMSGRLTADNHSEGGAEFVLRIPLLETVES